MSKTLHRNLQSKIAVLKGPEWDSSDEEEPTLAVSKKPSKEQRTSTKRSSSKSKISKHRVYDRKQRNEKDEEDESSTTVVYIGHLPGEFEERDLKIFLNQFGKVVNLRISRSVKTGNSRGYAFCKFVDAEVATIVADTLGGYFLGNRRLVCHLVPNPHKSMFYDTDKAIARHQLQLDVDRKKRNRALSSAAKLKIITDNLVSREQTKREKLKAMGIDYDFPGYAANQNINDDDDEDDEVVVDQDAESMTREGTKEEVNASDHKKTKKKKRKDSVGSESSSTRKRKDSVGSESSSASKKKSKRKSSVGSLDSEVPSTPDAKQQKERKVQTEKKAKKKSKSKRRTSVP